MEVFALLGYIFGLNAWNEVKKLKEEKEYEWMKNDWKERGCKEGRHFVAEHTNRWPQEVWCEACEMRAIMTKAGWKWPKE